MKTNEVHKAINIAARLTSRANHCATLLRKGFGIPIILIAGMNENKAKAKALLAEVKNSREAK